MVVNGALSTPVRAIVTCGEVLDAAKCVLGEEFLPVDVDQELRRIARRYVGHLDAYSRAYRSGNTDIARRRLNGLFQAPTARIICYLLAYPNGAKRLTFEELKFQAAFVNPRKPSNESVRVWRIRKSSGGMRTICSFGPRVRAAQRMVEHTTLASIGHSEFEFARCGRGREAAIRSWLHAIQQKGVRWFGIADVKDFFQSVTLEMVEKVLPHIPQSIIRSTIFIPDETVIHTNHKDHCSAQAIRKGLPQGSLASLLIAAKILELHLSELGAIETTVHVDNIMVGGKNEGEVQALLDALRFSLEKQPQGSLRLTSDVFKLSDPKMDYLGYRLRRKWRQYGGFGRAQPSRRSFENLYRRCALSLLLNHWRDCENIAALECAQWVRRFPQWERRLECEDLAFINVLEDVDPAVQRLKKRFLDERMTWKSFMEMGLDLRRFGSEIAQSTPPLFAVQPV